MNLIGLFLSRLPFIVSIICQSCEYKRKISSKDFIWKEVCYTRFRIENNFHARNIKLYFVIKKCLRLRLSLAQHKNYFHTFETSICRFHVQDSHPVLNRSSRPQRLASCEKRDLFSRAPELVFSAKPPTGSRDWLAPFRMLWKETRLCREMKLRDGLLLMCRKVHSGTCIVRVSYASFSAADGVFGCQQPRMKILRSSLQPVP